MLARMIGIAPSGPPPRPARLAGVELGGTKCIVTLALADGTRIEQVRVPTTTPAETLAAIEAVLDRWWAAARFGALGVASFGPIALDPAAPDYGHLLATPKPGWAGADVGARLSRRFPVPAAVDTDVNAAALAEMRWGSGRGLADFAYITVGTGIGVGLIVDGRPPRGIGHCELGHLRVPRRADDDFGSACRFHPDCVEGLASGTAIRAALGGRAIDTVASDDPVWRRVVDALACLCHALRATGGPRRIALGGGVILRQPHLIARIDAALRASLNGYLTLPAHDYLVPAALGDQAGPLGAIALALDAAT